MESKQGSKTNWNEITYLPLHKTKGKPDFSTQAEIADYLCFVFDQSNLWSTLGTLVVSRKCFLHAAQINKWIRQYLFLERNWAHILSVWTFILYILITYNCFHFVQSRAVSTINFHYIDYDHNQHTNSRKESRAPLKSYGRTASPISLIEDHWRPTGRHWHRLTCCLEKLLNTIQKMKSIISTSIDAKFLLKFWWETHMWHESNIASLDVGTKARK